MGSVRLSAGSRHFVNVARACAALYVVIHHVELGRNFPFPFSIFKHFGHQAVIAFFLLSGFVIHANERHRVLVEPGRYALRRIFRIYPALIVAMALSIAIVPAPWSLREALGNLLALQDSIASTPGTWVGTFQNNAPLWSLSYELWFYLLYPLVMVAYARSVRVTHIGVGLLCGLSYALYIVHPNHFLVMTAYFASWWLGAMIAEAYGEGRRSIRAVALPAAGLAFTCIIAALPILHHRGANADYPILQLNHLFSALLFAILIFGPIGAAMSRALQLVPVGLAATAASVSYGLYVFHWPLLLEWQLSMTPAGLVIASLVLLAAAWLFDRELSKPLSRLASRRHQPV